MRRGLHGNRYTRSGLPAGRGFLAVLFYRADGATLSYGFYEFRRPAQYTLNP